MTNREVLSLLDIMRVPAEGNPLPAIVAVDHQAAASDKSCEILVVGGGMGGVAAAWAAARRGHSVCLLEETGGQMTSQGIAALDEHGHIETFGGTRSYYELCNAIRSNYQKLADSKPVDGKTASELLNPGNCWVSRLAFEPIVAVNAINELLSPWADSGQLRVFLRTKVAAAETDGDRVIYVKAINLDDSSMLRFSFQYILDATELGDLLSLTGTEYVVGAESVKQTSEPHAQPSELKPRCVQSCTYTFALERRSADKNHRIPKPTKYEHYRDNQPYSLHIHVHGGEIYGEKTGWLEYHLFENMSDTKGPLWTYRRLVDASQFPNHYEHDLTMFNWPGNDYRDLPLVDQSPEILAAALQDAKRVSLGFVYWLQTEVPNPHGAPGFPSLLLRPDVMATNEGLSKHPYIRECRRIKAVKTTREQDVAVSHQSGPRASHYDDSVGVGWYPIDIHPVNQDEVGTSTRTKPFQIPLGALIPIRVENLIAANKNIGTTHITNGCYRLHPVEWNIGEAAGLVAAFALEEDAMPKTIHEDKSLLRSFQQVVITEGIPLSWLTDVPVWSPHIVAAQWLVMAAGYDGNEGSLKFHSEGLLLKEERAAWLQRAAGINHNDSCGDVAVGRAVFASAVFDE